MIMRLNSMDKLSLSGYFYVNKDSKYDQYFNLDTRICVLNKFFVTYQVSSLGQEEIAIYESEHLS